MGEVFEAVHVHVGRRVALKVLHPFLDQEAAKRRFRIEPKAASAAGHPNIVDVLDAGELEDGRPFIAMEFLAGRTIKEVLQDQGRFAPLRVVRIGIAVAEALQAAHEAGIIHRDLKSENVMLLEVRGEERVKVVDFGIAYGVEDANVRLTMQGRVVGTPNAMAPEQSRGIVATPSFDVYALGVLLYEMLSGTTPFVASSVPELLAIKASMDAPSIRTHREDLPASLVAVVDRCLLRDPLARPASARAVANALRALERDVSGRGSRWRSRAAAPALLGIGGAVVVGLVAWLQPESPSSEADEVWAEPRPSASAVVAATSGRPRSVDAPPPTAPPSAPATLPVPATPPVPATRPVPATPEAAAGEAELSHPTFVALEPPVAVPPAPEPSSRTGDLPPAPPRWGASRKRDKQPVAAVAAPAPREVCDGVEVRAREARAMQSWDRMMADVRRRECWSDAKERQKLEVLGFKEQGRFADCVAAARGSEDPSVLAWATICEKRSAKTPP